MSLGGHKLTGWICSECGVVARGDGVVPGFGLEVQAGVPTPVLRVESADGHAQVVMLGYENLAILIEQGLKLWADRANRQRP
jgi:hypothetical protein